MTSPNRSVSSLLKKSLLVNSTKMKWIKSKSKTMETKKSNSCWWSSLISLKNSKWLQDNLEEMDQKVKLMLKLIEEDADSFSKRAEIYYQKRPELITLVEDFNRMYRALAERYDAITGELRKTHVLPYDLQSNGSETSDVGSPPPNSPLPDEQQQLRRRITELETELSHMKENENAKIAETEAMLCKKNDDVEELNKMIEDLKVNYDEIRSEKESLDAKIRMLSAEMSSKDAVVEHLSERVKELEIEVERKEQVIKQGAEEKREAIRQLCLSIEHYRSGNHWRR